MDIPKENMIKTLRLKEGFSKKELAEKVKVPINKIVGWENGYGEISVKQVKILSSIFDVTNDMILLGIENSRVDLTGITNEQQNEVMNIWEFLLKEGGNHGIF